MIPSATGMVVFAGLLIFLWVRRPPRSLGPVLVLMQVAGLLYCAGDLATGHLTLSPRWHFFWLCLEYAGVQAAPVAWWVLSVQLSEQRGHPVPPRIQRLERLPVLVAAVCWLAVLTNPWHGQMLTPHPGGRSEFHWVFWVQVTWIYGLVAAVFAVYVRLARCVSNPNEVLNIRILMSGSLVVLGGNLVYLFAPPSVRFDPTGSMLAIATLFYIFGVYRIGMSTLLPVALAEMSQHESGGTVLTTSTGRVLHANPAVAALFGTETLRGTPDLFAFLARRLRPAEEAGGTYARDALADALMMPTQGGEGDLYRFGAAGDRWVRVESTVIQSHMRSDGMHILRFRDVTDARRHQQAVLENEATLRQVIDLVPHFIFAKDEDGRFILVNQAVADAYGTTVDSLLEKRDADFASSAEEVEHFRRDDLEVIASGQPKFIPEEQITDAQQRVRLLQTTKIPFTTHRGGTRAVLGVSVDITDRDRDARRLRRQSALLQGVAESTSALLTMPDHETAIARALEILGRSAHVNRVYMLRIHPHPETLEPAYTLAHEWREAGLPPRPPEAPDTNVPIAHFGFQDMYKRLMDGQVMSFLTRELPRPQRTILEAIGAKAHLLVPIFLGDGFWGLVGFDDFADEREWLPEEESILGALANSLAGAIDREGTATRLRRQSEVLRGVAEAARELLTIPDHTAAMERALATVGRAADVDRVYVMRIHPHPEDGRQALSLVHGWLREDSSSVRATIQFENLVAEEFGWEPWLEAFARGEIVGGPLRGFTDVPTAYFASHGVLSHVLVPIFVRDTLWGIVGFDDCETERAWTGEEESILSAMSTNLAGAIEREEDRVALQASEGRFRRLVEDAPLGVLSCDRTGKVLALNPKVLEILGSPSIEATMAINLLEFPPLVDAGVSAFVRRCLETGERDTAEISYTSAWGKTLELRMHGAPTFGPTGVVTGLQAIIEDVTERRRAEAALLHTQKLESLGVLAGGIAHDFNNLLVSVMGNASLALSETGATAPIRAHLEGIETAAERASDLTRQLLAYAGKGKFVVEALNLTTLVEEMTHLLDVSMHKTVMMRFDLAHDVPPVEADAVQLRQIIMNLVINASDAIGEHDGVITIRTGAKNGADCATNGTTMHGALTETETYVYLQVADTGGGMDAETVARIFDPFFTTKFTGRGLGLAAVLGIVRGHKGAVTVESEPGRGAVFTVYFPRTAAVVPEPSAPERPLEPAPCTGTILVVDDDADVAAVARQMLEHAGFAVVTAADGLEALDVFDELVDEIGAVLLDMTMPRMSGEETFLELRRRREDLPVILSTGFSEQEAMARFAGQDLAGFVQKPYRSRALVAIMREGMHPADDTA